MREHEFIDWIVAQTKLDPATVPVGPGDDCAVVRFGSSDVLVTTDQVLDGVHFRLSEHGPRAAGRKAMARNLSDVAAMAAIPTAAVATVSLPRGMDRRDVEDIYRGLRSVGDAFQCPVVGGDVGSWDGPLAISVTLLARRAGVTGGIAPILRSGAKPGNALCVTGSLGGAWRTAHHLEFTPRIAEAICLAMNYGVKAMIDLSDGLATDLGHLCRASRVGAEVLAEAVPVSPAASELTANPAAALHAALCDGEDYELLFALPSRLARKLCDAQPLPVPVTRIGRFVAGDEITLVHGDGRREGLAGGWEHTT